MNNTVQGDAADDESDNESESDNKKKRLNKFLDDNKFECEQCIDKLKQKNKKIKIICYSLLTLSVVGQTVASTIASMLVPTFVITGITGTTAVASALSGQLKLRSQKTKIASKICELNVIKNKIHFLGAINGDFSEERIEEIFLFWNYKLMVDYWGRPIGNGTMYVTKSELNNLTANCVKKTGDTMTGTLNMTGSKIGSVSAPAASGDAANKQYVEGQVS